MSERLEVTESTQLLKFLRSRLEGWTVRTLKKRLRFGSVSVNGEPATRHDFLLEIGDRVEVAGVSSSAPAPRRDLVFTTLYLDNDIVAIDKPAGLLSVSTDEQRDRTALSLVRDSLSSGRNRAMLWPVHRLDRETSGVMLFARTREFRDRLQSAWANAEKTYLAVVEGQLEVEEGVIEQPLWEDRSLNVRVGHRSDAKDARTLYHVLKKGRSRSMLQIRLDTGRRHQIRAHLTWLGHPVVGDRRYGTAGTRMGLHAVELTVQHPRDNSRLTFKALPPKAFLALFESVR